jgi:hypothetical protein
MSSPKPIPAVICDVCRLPWDDHLTQASYRVEDRYDEDDCLIEQPDPVVITLDCLRLTQEAQRGPMGHPGPVGMSGAPGRSCDCAVSK